MEKQAAISAETAQDDSAGAVDYGNRIFVLSEALVQEKRRKDALDRILTEALRKEGFEMYYQPIYSTAHSCFESAEALIRMKNTGGLGFVSPEEFIPMAEEKGLIMEIGDRTLELVTDFIRESRLLSRGIHYAGLLLFKAASGRSISGISGAGGRSVKGQLSMQRPPV